MTTPTAANYAAALAALSTMCVADGADVLEAALTYVRAKLAADVALLRSMADATLAAVAAEPLLPCAVPRATTAGGTAGAGVVE